MNASDDPVLNYFNPKTVKSKKHGPHFSVLRVAIAIGLIILAVQIFLPTMNHRHGNYPFMKCSANLRTIGQAVQMYIADNPKSDMPSLQDLTKIRGYLSPKQLICQSVDHPVSDPNPCDYVFLGEGKPRSWFKGKDRVIAFEKPGHHKNKSSVLYADGHVDLLTDDKLLPILSELLDSRNPPFTKPSTQPTTRSQP